MEECRQRPGYNCLQVNIIKINQNESMAITWCKIRHLKTALVRGSVPVFTITANYQVSRKVALSNDAKLGTYSVKLR
jgi:hypothetical protein